FATMNYSNASMNEALPTDEMKKVGAIGLSVTIPLWNGGEKVSRLKQVVSEKKIAQTQLKQYEKSLRLNILNAVSDYSSLFEALKANKKALALAKKSYQLTKDAIQTGRASVTALNDAELMETNLKLQVVMNIFELIKTKILIKRLISADPFEVEEYS
ncbi:MAG: TolC family protein, partial [Bacteriovoracia bacterium]